MLVWALVRSSSVHLQALEPGHCWAQMPKDWALILKGDSGDLTQFGVRDLTFARAPGHCSGHVVYNHKPSGYMLAGDFTDIIQGEDGSYKMHTMCNKSTCNITLAHETICRCEESRLQLMQFLVLQMLWASGRSWHHLKVLHGPALLWWLSKRCVGTFCSVLQLLMLHQ